MGTASTYFTGESEDVNLDINMHTWQLALGPRGVAEHLESGDIPTGYCPVRRGEERYKSIVTSNQHGRPRSVWRPCPSPGCALRDCLPSALELGRVRGIDD